MVIEATEISQKSNVLAIGVITKITYLHYLNSCILVAYQTNYCSGEYYNKTRTRVSLSKY